MLSIKVPLVPSDHDVIEEAIKPLPKIEGPTNKSLQDVVWNIFWSTLGANSASRESLKKLTASRPEIAEAFSSLVEAVRTQNAALTALSADRLLSRLFNRGMAAAIVEAVGQAEAAKLFGAVASRFVPFIGWGFWVVSFLFAIRENWSDITPFL
jgi:hypothetical protein